MLPQVARTTAAAIFVILSGSSYGADQQGYTVEISGAPSSEADAASRASSQLVLLQKAGGVPPFALITRARDDIARLQTALDSFGYYQNSVAIRVAGLDLDDPELPKRLDELPAGTPAPVKVTLVPGPLFHLGKITVTGAPPGLAEGLLAITTGDVAAAAAVRDAGARLLAALQEDGFALATVSEPDAVADEQAHTIDITYRINAGPRLEIGPITVEGLKEVNGEFVRKALTVHEGDQYRPSRIEAARQALAGLGVFSGVSVRAAEHPSADDRLPLTFDVQERRFHAVTLTGNYSTDLGISLSVTWSHRNLFGNAEQLNLTAAGTGLGSASVGLGYDLRAQYV